MKAAARPNLRSLTLAFACLLMGASVMATEEPHYDVVVSNDTYEIRRYEP